MRFDIQKVHLPKRKNKVNSRNSNSRQKAHSKVYFTSQYSPWNCLKFFIPISEYSELHMNHYFPAKKIIIKNKSWRKKDIPAKMVLCFSFTYILICITLHYIHISIQVPDSPPPEHILCIIWNEHNIDCIWMSSIIFMKMENK